MKPTTTRPRVVIVERIQPTVTKAAAVAATALLIATVTAALIRSWIIPMRRSVQVQELASAAIVRLLQDRRRRPNCRPCQSFRWRWRLPLAANLSSKSASSKRLTIWKRQSPSAWKCPKNGYASSGRIGKIFVCNDDVVTLKWLTKVDCGRCPHKMAPRRPICVIFLRDAGRSSLAYRHADIPIAPDRHFRFNSVRTLLVMGRTLISKMSTRVRWFCG